MHALISLALQAEGWSAGFILFVAAMILAIAAMIWLAISDPDKKDEP